MDPGGRRQAPPTPTEPVGTGPFVFESYESGENGHFHATRFEDYWRGDGAELGTGEGLPYLDAVEVRFMPDANAAPRPWPPVTSTSSRRPTAWRSSTSARTTTTVTELTNPYEIETDYLLINNQAEVGGAPNPFADIRVAGPGHATNTEALQATRAGGVFPIANGPFPTGRIGYLEDTGIRPTTSRAAEPPSWTRSRPRPARRCSALKTTTDPFNLTTAELLKEMWEEAGFVVSPSTRSPGRVHRPGPRRQLPGVRGATTPASDPDSQFVWWSSTTTPGIALNFGRIIDDEVDRLLGEIRTSTDEAERLAAAEDLNRDFAEQVFNVWTLVGMVGHGHRHGVHKVGRSHPRRPEDVTALIGGMVTPIEIFEDSAGCRREVHRHRLVQLVVVLLIVSFLAFLMIRVLPGDPVLAVTGCPETADRGPGAPTRSRRPRASASTSRVRPYLGWLGDLLPPNVGPRLLLRAEPARCPSCSARDPRTSC